MSYESMPSRPPTEPPSGPPTADAAAPEPGKGPTATTWIIGGVGAVVIAAAAIIGINAASGSDTVNTADTAAASTNGGTGATGQNGQAAPDGQGGFGQGRRGGGTFGAIESIDGSTITLTDQSGTTTEVLTTDETVVTSSAEATAADVKVGDNVRVIGSGTTEAITAERVVDSGDVAAADGFGGRGQGGPGGEGFTPPADGQMPDGFTPPEGMTPPDGAQGGAPGGMGAGDRATVAGTVESIDGTTMVVKAADGTTSTVTLSDSTTYTTTSTITVADLEQGDTISVRGETTDGKVTAVSISEGAGGFGGGFPGGAQGGPPNGAGAPNSSGQSNGATGSGSGSN